MFYLAQFSQHCESLSDPSWAVTGLAAFLVVGILVSYLPQHWKIIQRGSSEGLSPYWVLLGGLSSVAAIGNILTLPASRADMVCCKEIGSGACAAALLGVAQIGVQWTCFMIIVMLYLVFFPHSSSEAEDLSSSTASLTHTNPAKRRDPLIVGATIFISCFVVAIVSIALVFACPKHTQTWANILGTVSGVLAAIQYVPQIYHTWVLSDMKSLSVLTLVIQAPGAFLFAFSLWLRVGWPGWSTWLVYLVTGLLQFVLLAMAINYYSIEQLRKKRAEISDTEGESDDDADVQQNGGADRHPAVTSAPQVNERTALLSENGKSSNQGRS